MPVLDPMSGRIGDKGQKLIHHIFFQASLCDLTPIIFESKSDKLSRFQLPLLQPRIPVLGSLFKVPHTHLSNISPSLKATGSSIYLHNAVNILSTYITESVLLVNNSKSFPFAIQIPSSLPYAIQKNVGISEDQGQESGGGVGWR